MWWVLSPMNISFNKMQEEKSGCIDRSKDQNHEITKKLMELPEVERGQRAQPCSLGFGLGVQNPSGCLIMASTKSYKCYVFLFMHTYDNILIINQVNQRLMTSKVR